MRVSKEQAARNRERVVEVAGQLFRAHGFDGVGIDAVMAEAGLTHGGFYKSFGSKDDLIAEACADAGARSVERWIGITADAADPLAEHVTRYLSTSHLKDSRDGCVYAALAADAGRRDGKVRGAFTTGLRAFAAHVASLMPGSAEARRRKSLAAVATMIGALAMARATDDADFAEEILAAARTAVLGPDRGKA